MSDTRRMQPGTVVMGRWRVQELVGEGGMGAVYRAVDEQGHAVAVKCMHADRSSSARRFEREANMLAGLEHPAIVRCLGTWVSDAGERALVMEWLDGEDLKERLRRGRLTALEAHTLGQRMAAALRHAHARGVVHRDVKPGNIFLPAGRIEEAKLLDFGAARASAATTLTATGALVGTPSYMAPEQVRGERSVGPAADVWALGCVLYECLTGQATFAGHHMMAIFYKILMDEPPRVSELAPGVAPEVEALIARMLHKEPYQRPAGGADLVARFEHLRLSQVQTEDAMIAPVSRRDTLTRAERRMVSAVVVAGTVRLDEWLASRALTPEESPPVATLGPSHPIAQTLPERAGLHRIHQRFQVVDARFDELGDGSLIAVFDSRGAATDRADDAARCALALRAEYPDQAMAVATGRAFLTRERVLGEVIERAIGLIADRGQKPAGAIHLDATTADLVSARFSLERDARGALLIGESRAPVEQRLMGRATPFVGRRRELATLRAALDHCLDERVAQSVVVIGPAGAGKSRLRREFAREVASSGEDIALWHGRGDAMRAGSALAAIAEMLRALADIHEDEPIELRRDKLRARVARTVPAGDAERVTVFLGEIIGTRWSEDDNVQLAAARRDAQLMSDQLRRAFTDLVHAETAERALTIEIDDLHWSDRATVAMLDHVLRQLRDRPILVLGYGRDEVQLAFPDLWRERGVTQLRLQPLSERAAESLVQAVLGDDLARDDRARLIARGQGNPLFLEELMRCAAAGRAVSDTVLAMVEVRLQALSPEVRRVLRAASVFGDRCWRGGLEVLLGRECALDDALEVLFREELAARRSTSKFAGQAEYSLRHDLVREAAYHMLTDEDRRLGHHLAGEWLESVGEADALVLAEHYERAGETGRAIPFLARAAEVALEANDLDGAMNLAERGVAHGAEGDVLGALYAVQAGAHVWRGEYEPAIARGESALALLSHGSRAWYEVAERVIHAQGNLDQSAPLADLAESLGRGLPPGHDADGWSILAANVAAGLLILGRADIALPLLSVVEDGVRARADLTPAVLGHIHFSRAVRAVFVDGNPGAALRDCRQAVSWCELAGNQRTACTYQITTGDMESQMGLYAQAHATFASALERVEYLSMSSVADHARSNLGLVLLRLHRPDEASSLLTATVSRIEARGEGRVACGCRIHLALAYLDIGSLDQAEAEARAALDVSANLPGARAYALAIWACVLIARARNHEAMSAAEEAMALLRELGAVEEGEALIRLTHAEALHATGQHERARLAIEEARDHMLARAAKIDDPAWRQSFLDNVPENARTLELADRWLAP